MPGIVNGHLSERIGQINGTAFGCERWNVPSLKNLYDQLQALRRGSGCHKAFIDQIENGDNGPGPLDLMLRTVQGVLEEYGPTNEGLDQLTKATVTREEAGDIVVIQLQTDWLHMVKEVTAMYGSSRDLDPNGRWPGEFPPLFDEDTQKPGEPNRQEVRR